MERAVALKKLEKRFGKKLYYEVRDDALPPGEREALKAQVPTLTKERDELVARREARYKAVLAADPEYQALKKAAKEASEKLHRVAHKAHLRKFEVGTYNGLWMSVKATGDSWEEVIEKVMKAPA